MNKYKIIKIIKKLIVFIDDDMLFYIKFAIDEELKERL